MAPRSAGINGVAVLLAAAGTLFVYSGIKNATLPETLRSLLKGQSVQGKPTNYFTSVDTRTAGLFAGGGAGSDAISGRGVRIANSAHQYLGIPYKWGGATPNGFDCSGLVTWVLHHDNGIDLPSNTHTVSAQFMVWGGAVNIPRDQCAAGDLACWPGHIGIAIDKDTMINAPTAGQVVKIAKIWGSPQIRRIK